MPVLFLNGTNDLHFYLRSMQRSADLVRRSDLCVLEGFAHSHRAGWAPREIYGFIAAQIEGAMLMPRLGKVRVKGDRVSASYISALPLVRARLYYSRGTVEREEERVWESVPCYVTVDGKIVGKKPDGDIAVWFLAVEDRAGNRASGRMFFSR